VYTGVAYAVGDTVAQFAPLVAGAEVTDYVKDPTWFAGILNQGVFYEVQKFHTFLVRVSSDAFSLSSLLLTREFILRVKPVYTYPLFVVQLSEQVDEISVTDETTLAGTLNLEEGLCGGWLGAAPIFDDPRAAGGGPRSEFDNDADPGTTPTFPTALVPVPWGFDKDWLCPADTAEAIISEVFAIDFVPMFDSVFVLDVGEVYDGESGPSTITAVHVAGDSAPFTILPAGTAVTFVDSTVNVDGTLVRLDIVFFGLTDTTPDTYVVELQVNGSPILTSSAFAADGNAERVWVLSDAVTAGDTLTLLVKTTDGSPVTPSWTSIVARVYNSQGVWAFDAGETYGATPGPALLTAGTYSAVRTLV